MPHFSFNSFRVDSISPFADHFRFRQFFWITFASIVYGKALVLFAFGTILAFVVFCNTFRFGPFTGERYFHLYSSLISFPKVSRHDSRFWQYSTKLYFTAFGEHLSFSGVLQRSIAFSRLLQGYYFTHF